MGAPKKSLLSLIALLAFSVCGSVKELKDSGGEAYAEIDAPDAHCTELSGQDLNVELRLFEVDDEGEETGNYVTIANFLHTFKDPSAQPVSPTRSQIVTAADQSVAVATKLDFSDEVESPRVLATAEGITLPITKPTGSTAFIKMKVNMVPTPTNE